MPFRAFFANLAHALRLMRRASPRAFFLAVGINVFAGISPAALVYAGAQLIERLAAGSGLAAVAALVVAYVLLAGFHDCLNAVASFVLDTMRDATRMSVKADVNRAVSTFPDLGIHEDAELRETAVLCANTGESIADLVGHLYAVCLGVVMIVPVLLLTGGITWWMPGVMLLGTIPAMLLRARAERASWDVQERYASTFNELRILDRVLTQPEFAKDIRVYRMPASLLDRWRSRYRAYLATATRVRMRNACKLAATSLFASACLGVPLYAIARGFGAGRFSVGDLAIFLGALTQLRDGLAAIVYNIGDLIGVSYTVRPYRHLLAQHAQAVRQADSPCPPEATNATEGAQLALRAITLRYRSAKHDALRGIDLCVRRGETIAVVGDNGAGKTSLMKLVCGLYGASSGNIAWDRDGRRPNIVAVFQDFARFPLSPRENLALVPPAAHDNARIADSLCAVGLADLMARLDAPLTNEIEGGADLSGGQWQRLAIARAIVHADEADLLIFDEPTSALDPESEAQLMRLMLKATVGKTAFVVSHRLALTRFVDRIIVLHRGQIIEDGQHDALMEANGKYARMFRAQAAFYVSSPTEQENRQ
jgi:ATP-binding cassette, subfamily B, bacterial